jgi:hypothetical protein
MFWGRWGRGCGPCAGSAASPWPNSRRRPGSRKARCPGWRAGADGADLELLLPLSRLRRPARRPRRRAAHRRPADPPAPDLPPRNDLHPAHPQARRGCRCTRCSSRARRNPPNPPHRPTAAASGSTSSTDNCGWCWPSGATRSCVRPRRVQPGLIRAPTAHVAAVDRRGSVTWAASGCSDVVEKRHPLPQERWSAPGSRVSARPAGAAIRRPQYPERPPGPVPRQCRSSRSHHRFVHPMVPSAPRRAGSLLAVANRARSCAR